MLNWLPNAAYLPVTVPVNQQIKNIKISYILSTVTAPFTTVEAARHQSFTPHFLERLIFSDKMLYYQLKTKDKFARSLS